VNSAGNKQRVYAGLPKKLRAEAAGTFFVTLVAMTVDILYFSGAGVDYVSRWLARGFITTALIYAFSEVSGAHIDPAVSLGFALRGTMGPRQMFAYWSAQFAGAFGAALLAQSLFGHAIALGASRPGPHISPLTAMITEVVVTFLLLLVIISTAEQEATVGKQAAVAVGLTVAACGFFAGPISGASMNPARSIAPQILAGHFDIVWIYAVGPCVGAALAALVSASLFGKPDEGERRAGRGA
jgi:aquaporin Z